MSRDSVKVSLFFAALSAFDGVMTWYGVAHDYVSEANPLMAWALAKGLGTFALLKGIPTAAGVAGLMLAPARVRWLGTATQIALGLHSAVAVMHVAYYFMWRLS